MGDAQAGVTCEVVTSRLGSAAEWRLVFPVLLIWAMSRSGLQSTHSSCGHGDVDGGWGALVLGDGCPAESLHKGAVLHIHLHERPNPVRRIQ